MKQNTTDLITRKVLQEEVNRLDKKIDTTANLLRLEIRLNGEKTIREITDVITNFKDLILTTVDPLLRELEDRRQDRELSTQHQSETKEILENHEKRISALEKHN